MLSAIICLYIRAQASRGRTYDQPVDGFVVRNGSVYVYVHTDVPGISRQWDPRSRLTRYKLRREALERLTRTAHLALPGCAGVRRRIMGRGGRHG
jgi:hypothetical protein